MKETALMEYEGLFRSNSKETELGSVNKATKATNRRDFFRQRNNYRNREGEFYSTDISDCQSIDRLSRKIQCIANKWFISVSNGNDDVCKQSSIKLATYIQGDDLLNKIYTKVRNVLDILSVDNEPFIGCTALSCQNSVTNINNADVELIRIDYEYANSISNSTMSTTDTNNKKAITSFCKTVVEGINTLCGSGGGDLYRLKGLVLTTAVLQPYKVSTEVIFSIGISNTLSPELEMAALAGTSGTIGELTKNCFSAKLFEYYVYYVYFVNVPLFPHRRCHLPCYRQTQTATAKAGSQSQ